ncbi:tRNA-dihydrouridine synthase family protein [Halopseudomonas aestusnigri]|jgi:tRNA-dihydrouridine synthase C|uniref:tRNA dihydrouridine synthase n=1 Tax=Halopseudomonas aestusnigri TaxID=857252 RepID=UPI001E487433|nr:tRNA-dihydrouridine synthase family protein [Halopseudomonas aestusnigri]UGV29395.1 tRNA-dihydrouridine synthase family protein [Halopseudomonas aestusnigri]|tara:strand:+ start:42291 stop:43283 length:993 start_codon:yes stop_codon:yes gene_type:complete
MSGPERMNSLERINGPVVLAPMEGLADAPMRDVLTRIGGIDWCVSEFIRVTEGLLNVATIRRSVPESEHGWCTRAGVPVRPQLLGSDVRWMGENAALLASMDAPAIDLNFGCPAKTVNRHRGGAALLTEPELLREIVASVRAATPAHIPVTAKMRLGLTDTSQTLECAQALADGGASEITVHARTKVEGYKPPAHWEWLARIRDAVDVPVIANGEVWSTEDYRRIREVSGCDAVMIGRGLVRCPDLGLRILQDADAAVLGWDELWPWLGDFFRQTRLRVVDRHAPGRLKQWLAMLGQHYPEARALFDSLRRETCADAVTRRLEGPLQSAA